MATPIQLEQLTLLLETVDQEKLLAMLPPKTRQALASVERPEDISEEVITQVAEAALRLIEAQGAQA